MPPLVCGSRRLQAYASMGLVAVIICSMSAVLTCPDKKTIKHTGRAVSYLAAASAKRRQNVFAH